MIQVFTEPLSTDWPRTRVSSYSKKFLYGGLHPIKEEEEKRTPGIGSGGSGEGRCVLRSI